MTTTTKLTVDGFSVDRPAGAHPADVVVWRRNGNAVQKVRDGGDDYGRFLVRLSVDGMYDIVEGYTHRTSEVEGLDRAITAMQEIRDRLVSLGHDSSGQCMMTDDWGRCKADTGHQGAHQFPTEEDWSLDQRIISSISRAQASA